jgi:hypothetical protein
MNKSLIGALSIAIPTTVAFAFLPTFTRADRILEIVAYPAFPGIYAAMAFGSRTRGVAVAIAALVNLFLYWSILAFFRKIGGGKRWKSGPSGPRQGTE